MTDPTVRSIWLAIATLAALMVGATAGLLAWIGGLNPATAALTGGGTFASTLALILTIYRFVTGASD